jgi:hypothetical protein
LTNNVFVLNIGFYRLAATSLDAHSKGGWLMSDAILADIFVMLCDWRRRCAWTSGGDLPVKIGEFIWERLSPESSKQAKVALGQVVAIRDSQQLEVVH